VADLNLRIDALERQLATITGQVEENGNRIRTLEEEARRRRTEDDARFTRLEAGTRPAAAAPSPSDAPLTAPATSTPGDAQAPAATPGAAVRDPASTDPAENAYLAGFRLWEAKRYSEAEGVLKAMVQQHPKHRRASWARNLLGRTYLDSGKPATAAETFLSNYQDLPQGDRAADSLFYLGASLMKLNKPQQACKVYDELADVYASTMRDFLKTSLPAARKQAKCA
jgi:TolA-binding protein